MSFLVRHTKKIDLILVLSKFTKSLKRQHEELYVEVEVERKHE